MLNELTTYIYCFVASCNVTAMHRTTYIRMRDIQIEKFKTVVRDHLTRLLMNLRQTFQAPEESTVECPRRIDVRK